MPRKTISDISSPMATWKAPQQSIKNATEVLKKHFQEMVNERRKAQLQILAANKKVTTSLSKELTKSRIDLDKIAAVTVANSAQAEAEIKKYRTMKFRSTPKESRLSGSNAQNLRNFAPMPFSPFSMMRTPPYDAFAILPPNPNPSPTSFWFANAGFNGGMNYFLDTPMTSPSPSNFAVGAAVGIVFNPVASGAPPNSLGIASVGMNAGESLVMSAHAGSNIFGYAHSEGSVGWIVEEFSQNGTFVRFVETTYVEEYYLDANWGQGRSANVNPPAFSSQTRFVTFPGNFYIILVWLWGDISAEGDQGWWSSQAAGFGRLAVESINVTWMPIWWLF